MSPLTVIFLLVLIAFGCAFFLSERIASRWTLSRRQRREQADYYFEEEPRGRQPEERRDEP
jgi:elongation factor P hydroxylase